MKNFKKREPSIYRVNPAAYRNDIYYSSGETKTAAIGIGAIFTAFYIVYSYLITR